MRNKILFLLSILFLLPSISFAFDNISATISETGVLSGFSIRCEDGMTNVTAHLLRKPQDDLSNPFIGSIYGYMRRPCLDGLATFDSFDLNSFLIQQVGDYPAWLYYFKNDFRLVVKDTTSLYAPDAPIYKWVINIVGAHNLYDTSVLRIEDDRYKTIGVGPVFEFDNVWKIKNEFYGNSNVLFLPGLQASRLYTFDSNCSLVNCENQLWEPNRNADVEKLYLDSSGNSIDTGIYTRDIIDESKTPISAGFVGVNIYKSFIEKMNNLVSNGDIKEWQSFAYDWRKDVFDVVQNGSQYDTGNKSLIQTLQDLADSSNSGNVTIVAHSNGGLLAKALVYKLKELKDSGQSNLLDKIDKIIFVAVPQIGTAKAIPAMLHGYDQDLGGGFILSQSYARELARNMKSAYSMLPGIKYMTSEESPVVFDDTLKSDLLDAFVLKYGKEISDFQELQSFLIGETLPQNLSSKIQNPIKLNSQMLEDAKNLHQKLDDISIPSSIKVFKISGLGINTVSSFKYLTKKNCFANSCVLVLDQEPIFTKDGDKTVVSKSASYGGGEQWWVDLGKYNSFGNTNRDREHKNILEVSDLLTGIESMLKNQSPTENNIFSKTKPIFSDDNMKVSVHSPVEIGVYDKNGNFTGRVCPENFDFCFQQEDIPNSTYIDFGEGKYIVIDPNDYQKTVLKGTDTGVFTYSVEKNISGNITKENFVDIPVTNKSIAEITIENNVSVLKVDTNADGINDIIIHPSDSFDPIQYLETMKITIKGFSLSISTEKYIISIIDSGIKDLQKGKVDVAKLKILSFKKVLENMISNPLNPKLEMLSVQYSKIVLEMLNNLLINLNK